MCGCLSLRRGFDLAFEALPQALVGGEGGSQDFDGSLLFRFDVDALIDDAHATSTEGTQNAIRPHLFGLRLVRFLGHGKRRDVRCFGQRKAIPSDHKKGGRHFLPDGPSRASHKRSQSPFLW